MFLSRCLAIFQFAVLIGLPALAQSQSSGGFASGGFMIAVQGQAAVELEKMMSTAPQDAPFRVLFMSAEEADGDKKSQSPPTLWMAIDAPSGTGALTNAAAWDLAHAMIDEPARYLLPRIKGADAVVPILSDSRSLYSVEPDIAIWDPEVEKLYEKMYERRDAVPEPGSMDDTERAPVATIAGLVPMPLGAVIVAKPRSRGWPPPARLPLDWHAHPGHSNLSGARAHAAASFGTNEDRVLVYHLDTGFYAYNDSIRPRDIHPTLSRSFLQEDNYPQWASGYDRFGDAPIKNGGHGAATLSILAGNHVTTTGFSGFLGGAPYARVAVCRIGNSVVHIRTQPMTEAINAAVRNNADVITMAAGGPPSEPLAKAVNRAYGHGIPLIFAAGDFFVVPRSSRFAFPVKHVPPHTTVYPARFDNVLAVTGITHEGRGYGRRPSMSYAWRADSMRGSYGPKHVLRHSLAAYTPNVVAHLADKAGHKNRLNAGFAGTSAATPQVAAAAALWLQYHRSNPLVQRRDFCRAELVYEALYAAARRKASVERPDKYLGRGALDARRMLDITPEQARARANCNRSKTAVIRDDWSGLLGKIIDKVSSDSGRERVVQVAQLDPSAMSLPPGSLAERAAAHERMLITEVAQLHHGSHRLREMFEPGIETELTPTEVREFLRVVADDPRSSQWLKNRIASVLDR